METFTDTDKKAFAARGISEESVNSQLRRFENGFPVLRLTGSATVGKGILRLDAEAEERALRRWDAYLADGGTVTKFVPASGAASRMFKALFAFVNGDGEEPEKGSDVDRLLDNLDRLPFLDELNEALKAQFGKTSAELKDERRYKDIIRGIIDHSGLNYGNLPKGLLTFHRYPDGSVRTPLEEQMVEGAQTAASDGNVRLHFTVSGNHRGLFERKIDEVRPGLEMELGVRFHIDLSEQKASTDTIAVNPDNTIFRDANGNPVFRPGGHGALIQNLGDIDSTVVFIKNIDNIVPDSEREITVRYKKVLAGVLIEAHDKIEAYLSELSAGVPSRERLDEMAGFLRGTLCTDKEGLESMTDTELRDFLRRKFDRPLRVCGMVKNEGEPGGGPYLAFNTDGTSSPQILESVQIDTDNPESARMMSTATHFNPVDLVCYVRDTEGKPYRLTDYIDHDTGFISSKSAEGRELRALELPGLWNGAMSDWSTIFVEVPAHTFNPVKTVNDLLRPVHQADK